MNIQHGQIMFEAFEKLFQALYIIEDALRINRISQPET